MTVGQRAWVEVDVYNCQRHETGNNDKQIDQQIDKCQCREYVSSVKIHEYHDFYAAPLAVADQVIMMRCLTLLVRHPV